ncbi:hypothetical protein [Paenibacillus lautus]|nr:hypothetical protein [Paenibacillus lautus]MBX4152282.1 hypothetical protein [Paenibacillus lautus]
MKIVFIESKHCDKLKIGDKVPVRVDLMTKSEMLCLLAREGIIELHIKAE